MYERTTKLEETLAQFMQVLMSNHKSIESTIKNLESQVGQLAKQIAENSSGGFGANTKKNPKEKCKAVMTRRKRETIMENEGRDNDEEELGVEKENEKEGDHMEERKIKKMRKKKMQKREIVRRRRRLRVSWQERRRRRLSQVLERKHYFLWCRLKKTRNDTLFVSLISSRNWRSLFHLEKPCNRCHSTTSFSKIC